MRGSGVGLGLGLASILAALGGVIQHLPAQDTVAYRRLTVSPKEITAGTRTERAGEHQLEPPALRWANPEQAPKPASVYVPRQCVGTRRCPLLVFVWTPWEAAMTWVRPMADKYGIILLGPGTRYPNLELISKPAAALRKAIASMPTVPFMPKATGLPVADTAAAFLERQHLDATLRQVFRQFAIDPEKIAIMGTCATGSVPVDIGGDNLHLFSRIISLSGAPWTVEQVDPPTPRTEFFFDAGLDESQRYFEVAQDMRRKGYRVTHAIGFRWHGHTLESYDHVGQWLMESWAMSDSAKRAAPGVIADPLPALTTNVLVKMTAFWSRFVQEPESIRMTARRAHLRTVIVPVGRERPMAMMVDMAALAAKHASVAADLKAAGLTAQEHDAYRVALASARTIRSNIGEEVIGSLDPASVMAKNVAFMNAHPDELQVLEDISNGYVREDQGVRANMWNMP